MKCGTAQPADQQQRAEHYLESRIADRARSEHRKQGPGHQQHARPPAVRERPKRELRDRTGQLITHRQHADRFQREAQLRNQERQQRREHVAVQSTTKWEAAAHKTVG